MKQECVLCVWILNLSNYMFMFHINYNVLIFFCSIFLSPLVFLSSWCSSFALFPNTLNINNQMKFFFMKRWGGGGGGGKRAREREREEEELVKCSHLSFKQLSIISFLFFLPFFFSLKLSCVLKMGHGHWNQNEKEKKSDGITGFFFFFFYPPPFASFD